VELLLALVLLAVGGAAIGALGRALLPGPDPMPLWTTVAIGVIAALGGGLIGAAVADVVGAIVGAVAASVALVYGFRRWKGRPTTAAKAAETVPPPAANPAQPAPAPTGAIALQADQAPRFCSNCGTEFKGDERFCTNCGASRG
jgi:hypothetical protein